MPSRRPAKSEQTIEAVGYVRVSTSEQADSGLSLEAQRSRITALCEANGWTLLSILEDPGLSAKTITRAGLQEALELLCPGRVLVCLKLDRLTRSLADFIDLDRLLVQKGAEFASVQERIDTTTATGRLMRDLIVRLSQWEREVIGERTRAALQVKKDRKERLGTTPLGYQTSADGTVLVDEEDMETVRMARKLRRKGWSLRKIAEHLTAAGRRTKRGGAWGAQTVANILRPRYLDSTDPKGRS